MLATLGQSSSFEYREGVFREFRGNFIDDTIPDALGGFSLNTSELPKRIIMITRIFISSLFIGDIEMENKFNELTARKVTGLNEKEKRADLKGGIFTHHFSSSAI